MMKTSMKRYGASNEARTEFMRRFATVWAQNHELRFGQLIANALYEELYQQNRDIFHIEDEEIIQAIERFGKKYGHA